MKILKNTANFFGITLSVVLSIVLLALLLAAPVVSAVCSFTEAKTIHKVIKDIDFVELVVQHDELRTTLAEYGIDGHFLDGVSETELVEDLVFSYVDSIFEAKAFNTQVVQDIVLSHKEEAISLFRRLAEENGNNTQGISDEEFFDMILSAIQTEWEAITSSLPSAEDMGLTQENYEEWEAVFGDSLTPLRAPKKLSESVLTSEEPAAEEIPVGLIILYLRSGIPVTAMIVAVAILSVLIVLLRWPRFKGFMWLAVVYLLAAVLTFVSGGSLSGLPVQQFLPQEGVMDLLILPVISVFAAEMIRWAIWIAVIGVVFLAVFVVGRVLLGKASKTHAIEETQDACLCTNDDAPAIEPVSEEEIIEE